MNCSIMEHLTIKPIYRDMVLQFNIQKYILKNKVLYYNYTTN